MSGEWCWNTICHSRLLSRCERRLGGKGFNLAVAVARLGCAVTLVASIGRDVLAQEFVEFTQRERVDFVPSPAAATCPPV